MLKPFTTERLAIRQLEFQDATKEYFFAVRLPDGTLIGAMGVIDHPDRTIEVGYWFGVDYQGKGYAFEALLATLDQIAADPLLASRPVFAETRRDNAASIRLLTKAGFYATGRPGPRPNRIEFRLRRERPRSREIDRWISLTCLLILASTAFLRRLMRATSLLKSNGWP